MPLPRQNLKVPGTSRERVITNNGVELQRQKVYMPAETWESLRLLAAQQKIGGSQVIARLIQIAAACNTDRCQAAQ